MFVTVVESDQKVPFSIATTPSSWGWRNPFLRIASLTFDPYLITLTVKASSLPGRW